MNREPRRNAQELWQSALRKAPEARRAFLDETCGEDAELRRQVEMLLADESGRDIRVLGYGGYADGLLRLQLSAAPPPDWISLVQSGEFAYSRIMGNAHRQSVVFQGDQALLRITERTVRQTFEHFSAWVATVNQAYRSRLKQKAAENQRREAERMREENKRAEEEALIAETLRTIKFRYGP